MITLKNGDTVPYNENFDDFFRELVNSVIKASLRQASADMKAGEDGNAFNEHLLRQIMDNSIFIVHQIEQLAKKDENLSRLLVTGCLFNCVVLNLKEIGGSFKEDTSEDDDEIMH
jgi:hypothetical protein